ncbi:MAG TPA: hypothetical protein VG223_01970 [Solirubrobacteraceae bacterium]|nr:hypothetical protein [Solirubrobacteraceae bacterium]
MPTPSITENPWMPAERRYEYRVERDVRGPARAEITLVRRARGRRGGDAVVIYGRRFKPRTESEQLERYSFELRQVAKHANDGTLGCFIDTQSAGGQVHVRLYERWFDGTRLHCEELAHRTFDAEDDGALVDSAEFVAELEDWAERRNEQRDLDWIEATVAEQERVRRALEQDRAAGSLARILRRE